MGFTRRAAAGFFGVSMSQNPEPPESTTYRYTPCPGIEGLDDMYIDSSESPGALITVATGVALETWCYNQQESGSEPATEGITWGDYWTGDACDPDGNCVIFQITNCIDGESLYTNNSHIMDAGNGTFTIEGHEGCWQAAGPPVALPNESVTEITNVVFTAVYSVGGEEGCSCCNENPESTNRWQYNLCGEYEEVPAPPHVIIEYNQDPYIQTILYDHEGTTYCYGEPSASCEEVTFDWTEYEGENCETCFEEYPGGAETEKWIYSACTEGCDDIVSTDQLQSDGISTIWVNCCYYEVPEGTTLTSDPDNEMGLTPDMVTNYEGPCEEVAGSHNSLMWRICEGLEGEEFLYTSLNCCEESGFNLFRGMTFVGFPDVEGCYTLEGPSSEDYSIECDVDMTSATCGEGECSGEQELWIYNACEGGVIRTVEPLHEEGASTIWYNCAFYMVPEETTLTSKDSDSISADQVQNLEEDCDGVGMYNSLEWTICEGMEGPENIYTGLSCCEESGHTIGIGVTMNGFAVEGDPCYTLTQVSEMDASVECEGINPQICGEEPC